MELSHAAESAREIKQGKSLTVNSPGQTSRPLSLLNSMLLD